MSSLSLLGVEAQGATEACIGVGISRACVWWGECRRGVEAASPEGAVFTSYRATKPGRRGGSPPCCLEHARPNEGLRKTWGQDGAGWCGGGGKGVARSAAVGALGPKAGAQSGTAVETSVGLALGPQMPTQEEGLWNGPVIGS